MSETIDPRVEALEELQNIVDRILFLIATPMIFWMQAGFTLLEAGSVRSKNTINILLKNLIDVCIATPCWFLVGYGIAYGSGNSFIGTTNYALSDFRYVFWIYQWTFCSTSVTIISGATAERIRFETYMTLAVLMTTLVYPFIVHWAWSHDGFLRDWKFIDFAGSGVVHMTGGFTALIAASFLKPRVGRFTKGKHSSLAGHSITLATLGVLSLWFGWFGFNTSSSLHLSKNSWVVASHAALNTMIAPSISAVITFIYHWYNHETFHLTKILNSLLAGLVSVTGSCGIIEPAASILIGVWSGIFYEMASVWLENSKIDDPLDAFAIHGACGLWGLLCVGLFSDRELISLYRQIPIEEVDTWGLLYGGGWKLFGVQVLGGVLIIAWVFLWIVPFFFVGFKLKLLRLSIQAEKSGYDFHVHKAYAYSPLEVKIASWLGERIENFVFLPTH